MQPDHLAEENTSRHAAIVRRTREAIRSLQETGGRVTFYQVAERAHVARSTLYRREDLRELVKAARIGTPCSDVAANGLETQAPELKRQLDQAAAKRNALRQRNRKAPSHIYSLISLSTSA